MAERTPRVLLTSASFERAYGGIAICVARLAKELASKELKIGLWAPDGSAMDSDVIEDTSTNLVRLSGPLEAAVNRFSRPDIIHDNGIWLPHNHKLASYAGAVRIPRIVSVHGMLEPWALQHKRIKKTLAWRFYQKRDLDSAHLIHATADTEVQSFSRMSLSKNIVVIPNGTDLPEKAPMRSLRTEPRVMLFLSRIHPKKGLPMFLKAWAKVRPKEWQLKIAGPDEGGHQAEVEDLSKKLGLDTMVSFLGPLDGEQVSAAYGAADAFVLPTHSENFGMVVSEALGHALPVLTTTAAPWHELETEKCGWSVPPSEEGLELGLRRVLSTPTDELLDMGYRGRALVAKNYAWEPVADKFISEYNRILCAERTRT